MAEGVKVSAGAGVAEEVGGAGEADGVTVGVGDADGATVAVGEWPGVASGRDVAVFSWASWRPGVAPGAVTGV